MWLALASEAIPKIIQIFYLSTVIRLGVIDVQLERPALVSLDQRKQIFGLVKHRVGADDVIRVRSQSGIFSRTRRMNFEDVPNVLVGALERTETDGDAEKALAAPQRARRDKNLANLKIKFWVISSCSKIKKTSLEEIGLIEMCMKIN